MFRMRVILLGFGSQLLCTMSTYHQTSYTTSLVSTTVLTPASKDGWASENEARDRNKNTKILGLRSENGVWPPLLSPLLVGFTVEEPSPLAAGP